MGPQPLSRVKKGAAYAFRIPIDSPNVELGTIVLSINNINAVIDYYWSVIFVYLMRADPQPAQAMYEALTSAEAKRAVILAAATNLYRDDTLLIQAVMSVTSAQRRKRNDFSHHLWGLSGELPDRLLLAPPSVFTSLHVGSLNMQRSRSKKPRPDLVPNEAFIQVYTRKALIGAHKEAEDSLTLVAHLASALAPDPTLPPGSRRRGRRLIEKHRIALSETPLVAQALQALSRQNALKAPPQWRRKPSPRTRKASAAST